MAIKHEVIKKAPEKKVATRSEIIKKVPEEKVAIKHEIIKKVPQKKVPMNPADQMLAFLKSRPMR